jgi:hypothetical protein
MAQTHKMMQLFDVINTKDSLKVYEAITKEDHEHLVLKDQHNNKIEVKFYPDYYKEDSE